MQISSKTLGAIKFNNSLPENLLKSKGKMWMNTRPSDGFYPKHTPQFGFSRLPSPGPFLRAFDFHNVGETLLSQSKVIYAALIGTRVLNARTQNERFEVMRRDFLGWYSWFFGVPLLQLGLTQVLTARSPELRRILVQPRKSDNSFISKLNRVFNPASRYYTTTIHQLKQREAQILSMLEKNGSSLKDMRQVRNLFNKASNIQVVTSFIGLAFTIFTLGVGINLLNIAITNSNLRRKKVAEA